MGDRCSAFLRTRRSPDPLTNQPSEESLVYGPLAVHRRYLIRGGCITTPSAAGPGSARTGSVRAASNITGNELVSPRLGAARSAIQLSEGGGVLQDLLTKVDSVIMPAVSEIRQPSFVGRSAEDYCRIR